MYMGGGGSKDEYVWGHAPGCTQTPAQGVAAQGPLPPPPSGSELEDPGGVPGNLAKIITTLLTFLNNPSVYQSSQRPGGPRAVASGVWWETQAWPSLGCRLRPSCPLRFPGNQRPHDPGQEARGLEPKGCGLERAEGELAPSCGPQRNCVTRSHSPATFQTWGETL